MAFDRLRTTFRNHRMRQFLGFFVGSATGLAIDLIGFQLLLVVGLEPSLANAISSATSITAVYLLVTRYSFGAGARISTYLAFLSWYALSIVTFSALIQLAVGVTDWHPFLWKLASVPISFGLNYVFSRFLFRAPKSEGGTDAESPIR